MIIEVGTMQLLVVINEMEEKQFTQEKYIPKSTFCNKTIINASISLFSGFVLLMLKSELMPGAISNLSVLSICSVDYT